MLSYLFSYPILIIAVSCSRRKLACSDWDKSGNNKIDNYEFVNGYCDVKLFRNRVTKNFRSLIDLTKRIFLAMDANSNWVIYEKERKARSDYFQFGFAQPSFEKWDKDLSGNLWWDEF